MEALSVIIFLLACTLPPLTAVSVFFILRKWKEDTGDLKVAMTKVLAMVIALKIQNDCEQAEKMSKIMNTLAEREDYEGAKKIKAQLDGMIENIEKQCKDYNEMFGDTLEVNFKKL